MASAPSSPIRPLRLVALSSFGFAAVQLCVTSYLVVLLVQQGGLDLVTAGAVFSAAQIGGVLGRIVLGGLADKSKPALILMGLGMTSMALMAAAGLLAPSWPFALKLAVGVSLGTASLAWNGIYLAEVARLAPEGQAGAVTGGALVLTYAGVVVGPPLFALLLDLSGWAVAFAATGGLGLVGGLLILVAARLERGAH